MKVVVGASTLSFIFGGSVSGSQAMEPFCSDQFDFFFSLDDGSDDLDDDSS